MRKEQKRFLEWIKLKEKLHNHQCNGQMLPYFSEGDIWWAAVGENIGTEINGKSRKFSRPVLILKKYDRHSFMAVPTTSKSKTGDWYVSLKIRGKPGRAVLVQARTMDASRLYSRMGRIPDRELERVRSAFVRYYFGKKYVPNSFELGVASNLENLLLLYQRFIKKSRARRRR